MCHEVFQPPGQQGRHYKPQGKGQGQRNERRGVELLKDGERLWC